MTEKKCGTCGALAIWQDAEGGFWCEKHRHSLVSRRMPEREDALSKETEKRIGRVEREQVIADLQRHLDAERITLPEFTERMEAAMAARTATELKAIMRDLPELRKLPEAGKAPARPALPRGIERTAWAVWIICMMVILALILTGRI